MRRDVIEKRAREAFSRAHPLDKILTRYDKDCDVLYVSFLKSEPEAADFGRCIGDYIIRVKDSRVIGVTVLDALSHLANNFADSPKILWPESLLLA